MNPKAFQLLAVATVGLTVGPSIAYGLGSPFTLLIAGAAGLMWMRAVVLIGVKVGWILPTPEDETAFILLANDLPDPQWFGNTTGQVRWNRQVEFFQGLTERINVAATSDTPAVCVTPLYALASWTVRGPRGDLERLRRPGGPLTRLPVSIVPEETFISL